MIDDERLALFLLLGQTGERNISLLPDVAPPESLPISESYDLASIVPESVKRALAASEAYKLFFVFEEYLRELVVDVLTTEDNADWYSKVPADVKLEIEKLEETEEAKSWMALGSRSKAALMTYPQLLRVIDHCWKDGFEEIIRDKSLIQESRLISHLRNTICHMSSIPEEEINRIRQTMRDWFRIISP
jgi:hypothetical protein